MASNANLVVLMGNLTRNPELRYTPSGSPVTTLNIAVNRRYKDRNSGEWVEKADFIPVSVWGTQAENCEKYLSKGRGVYIEGRLSMNRWENPDGESRSRLEVVAGSVQFLPGGASRGAAASKEDENEEAVENFEEDAASGGEDEDEEIPF